MIALLRPRSLRTRLGLLYALIAAAMLVTVYGVADATIERALVQSAAERLQVEAGLVVADAGGRRLPTATDLAAGDLASALGGYGTAVAIIGADGAVLASAANGADQAVLEARLSTAEYQSVVAEGQTITTIRSTGGGTRMLVVASPVQLRSGSDPGGQGQGQGQGRGLGNQKPGKGPPVVAAGPANAVAQLAISLAGVDAMIAGARTTLQLATLGLLIVAGVAVWLVTRRGLLPLERVTHAADRIASGDLTARASLPGGPDEVGRLGTAFDDMAARVDATLRAQRAFAADASHELRSPLTVLGGYVDVLARDAADEPQRARTLRAMRRELDRLSRLSADLLLLTQLEAGGGRLDRRPLDLGVLAKDIADAAGVIGADREVVLERDGPLPVEGDPDRLTQAVMNLVDNAVHHTPAGGRIRIATSRAENDAIVTIANTGPPIASDEVHRVFDRFYRARGEPADGHHAGLGLAIVKAIVEASGGSVGVTSDDQETRFSIRLPAVV